MPRNAPRLRVLVDAPGAPAQNMALDEALMLAASEPTLRFYGWQPATVSLGYFQRRAEFADVPRDTPIVRRLTGGGAIHHGDELTFALAVDATLLPGDIASSYTGLHDAIVAVLRNLGVPCERLTSGKAQSSRPADRWCFAVPGQDDIVTAHGKLLGSAQRRVRQPRTRVLHHGSLVLSRPTLTPFVAAVDDFVAVDDGFRRALIERLTAALGSAIGCQPEAGECTATERDHAARLTTRYLDPSFTARL
ncbi:MAG: lipoate--protein ligase family protein [bacterium]|nr:lipoate--protein ligase family protein [bacterium]